MWGSCFKPGSRLLLTGYSNVDSASSIEDCKSIGGYIVYFGCNLVSWQSKKQGVVARSNTESEYRALAQVASEITWLNSLLSQLQFPFPHRPAVWCDNMSATALARNPVFHAWTKHIEIDIHYIWDQVLKGSLFVYNVSSHDQIADCFTKSLSLSFLLSEEQTWS
ncbi:hypothetical protein Scep_027407 [Stephania cephalantha]|uniref:Retrovirus-related Pol polyprotein from transposon RE2 n=1 Tax=Stephania cephalantha TaxID=152367 RepID=A0AAP0EA97_9MAGN